MSETLLPRKKTSGDRRRLLLAAIRRNELLIDAFDLLSLNLPLQRRQVYRNGLTELLRILKSAEAIR